MPATPRPPLDTFLSPAGDVISAAAAAAFCCGLVLLRGGLRGDRRADAAGLFAEVVCAAAAWLVCGATLAGGASPLSGGGFAVSGLAAAAVWTAIAGGGLAVAGTAVRGRVLFAGLAGGLLYPATRVRPASAST